MATSRRRPPLKKPFVSLDPGTREALNLGRLGLISAAGEVIVWPFFWRGVFLCRYPRVNHWMGNMIKMAAFFGFSARGLRPPDGQLLACSYPAPSFSAAECAE